MSEVVITGMGAVTPAGIGVDALWQGACEGRSYTKPMSSAVTSDLMGHHSFASDSIAEIPDLSDAVEKLPVDFRDQDRFIQLAGIAATEAIEQAEAWTVLRDESDRAGVVFSTAICGTREMERQFLTVTEGGNEPIDPHLASPYLYLASMSSTPAHMLASLVGAHGPSYTLSTGCIGGIDAFGAAFEEITLGECDIVLCGASEAPITPVTVAAFEVINCLSQRFHGESEKASRPFDAERDGFVLGEGAAFFVMESRQHALERGARPLFDVAAFCSTSNALHMTDLVEDGVDLSRSLAGALTAAHVDPKDIDYVSAHGSSTPQNDRFETGALKRTLGERAQEVPVSSAKSMLGHALSAASAIELALCGRAFSDGLITPTVNYVTADPECDLDYVTTGAREWQGDTILKGASGFAGLHASVVLARTSGAER